MNYFPVLWCALLCLSITAALIPLIRICAIARALGNDAREFHQTHNRPVPRLGGLAIAVAFVVAWIVDTLVSAPTPETQHVRWVILGSALAMFVLGFWDDLLPIGARKKFLWQVLIALGVCAMGLGVELFKNPFTGEIYNVHWAGWILTVLWLVGMTNLINLIDGIDGLAGGVSLMLMVLLAVMAASTHGYPLMIAGVAGAIVGFLFFNFPPARIYMGDGGAYLLGFLIGILSLVQSHKGTVAAALIAPLVVLALPILDVTVAIGRRGLRGLPIFRPDRRHLHHRLLQSGFSHRRVVLILYGFTLMCLVIGFGVFWSEGRLAPLALGGVCFVMLVAAQTFGFNREWFSVGRVLGNSLDMRRESQYALALARWLELEGERAATVEGLWTDFTFLAGKLGFNRVRLSLPDGSRVWESPRPELPEPTLSSKHELGATGEMSMEFTAPASAMSDRMFEHLCELTMEAWVKAAMRWKKVNDSSLAFSARAADASPGRPPLSVLIPATKPQDLGSSI